MVEINTPKEANGYIYTILDLEENAIINCPSNCFYLRNPEYNCSIKDKISHKESSSKSFKAIKLTVNVKNLTNTDNWVVGAEDIMLVDEDGYTYEGIILCEELLPLRTAKDRTNILPHTQLNYIQLFPNLPDSIRLSSARININRSWVEFKLSNNLNKVKKLGDVINGVSDISESHNSELIQRIPYVDPNRQWELNKIKERITKLRTLIYSRLNNILTSSEKTKLENKIINENYAISLELENKSEEDYRSLLAELELLINQYNCNLKKLQELDYKRKSLSQKVDELIELTPREFEEYVAELLRNSGYDNVELTPYSNDKGLDVIAYKDGLKYGVQCKRYRGTVGSPEIQRFLGALSHAKADTGLFITTGMFSFEAEKMACEHPIVLVNRLDLAKMVFKALTNINHQNK